MADPTEGPSQPIPHAPSDHRSAPHGNASDTGQAYLRRLTEGGIEYDLEPREEGDAVVTDVVYRGRCIATLSDTDLASSDLESSELESTDLASTGVASALTTSSQEPPAQAPPTQASPTRMP